MGASGFTVNHAGLARSLLTKAGITPAFDTATLPGKQWPKASIFTAIWDTGATNTVITQAVVDACSLHATGMVKVVGVNGPHTSETYLVNIELPNGTGFQGISVTKGNFSGGQILIGMDLISQGDFAITHPHGKTVFTFQCPSVAHIDFKSTELNIRPNERCHCGSGKKFKKCCGGAFKN